MQAQPKDDDRDDSPKLGKTQDYNDLNIMRHNRPINARQVKKVKALISENDLCEQLPIRCVIISGTEKLFIVDGQHTYTACKELGLPLYYTIIDHACSEEQALKLVIALNVDSKEWNVQDALYIGCKQQILTYVGVKALMEEFPFVQITILLGLLGTSPATFKHLKCDVDEEKFAIARTALQWTKECLAICPDAKKTASLSLVVLQFREIYENFTLQGLTRAVNNNFQSYSHKTTTKKETIALVLRTYNSGLRTNMIPNAGRLRLRS